MQATRQVTAWLDGGATASYGTVAEPCNYTQKFSQASVLIGHNYRGDSRLEAHWKSVQWPGQGLFVGEPLAQPFRNSPSFSIQGASYVISTRGLRSGSHCALEYRVAPSKATQLRWVGPCAADATLQCTLGSSN